MKIRFSKEKISVRIDLAEIEALASGRDLREEFSIPSCMPMHWTIASGAGPQSRLEKSGDSFLLIVAALTAISLKENAINRAARSELEADLMVPGGVVSLEVDILSTRRKDATEGGSATGLGEGGHS